MSSNGYVSSPSARGFGFVRSITPDVRRSRLVRALQRDDLVKVFESVDLREVDPRILEAKRNLVGIPDIIQRLRVVKSVPGSPDWESKCFNSDVIWRYIIEHLPKCGLDDMSSPAWKSVLVKLEGKFPVSVGGNCEKDFTLWKVRYSALSDIGSTYGKDTSFWIKGTRSGLGESPSNKTSLESGYSLDDMDLMAETKLRFKAMMSVAAKAMSTPKYLRDTTRDQMEADRNTLNSVIKELVDDRVLISLLTVQDLPNKRFSDKQADFSFAKDLTTKNALLTCLRDWKKELVAIYYENPGSFDFYKATGKKY
jgi:hypothetical protein